MKKIKKLLFLIMTLIITIVSNIINFNIYLGYGKSTIINMIISLFFLIGWLGTAIIVNKKHSDSLIFVFFGGLIQIVFVILAYSLSESFATIALMFLPAILVLSPLSGITEIILKSNSMTGSIIVLLLFHGLLAMVLGMSENFKKQQNKT